MSMEQIIQIMDEDIAALRTNSNESYLRTANMIAYSFNSICHTTVINSHKDNINITCGKCSNIFDITYGEMMVFAKWCPKCDKDTKRPAIFVPKESIAIYCAYLHTEKCNPDFNDIQKNIDSWYEEFGENAEDICYIAPLINNQRKRAIFIFMSSITYETPEPFLEFLSPQDLPVLIPYQICKMGLTTLKQYLYNKMKALRIVSSGIDSEEFSKEISAVNQKLLRRIWNFKNLYITINVHIPGILKTIAKKSPEIPEADTTAIPIPITLNTAVGNDTVSILNRKIESRDFEVTINTLPLPVIMEIQKPVASTMTIEEEVEESSP